MPGFEVRDHSTCGPSERATEVGNDPADVLPCDQYGLLDDCGTRAPYRMEGNSRDSNPLTKNRVTAREMSRRIQESRIGNLVATVFELDLHADPRRGFAAELAALLVDAR